MSPDPENVKFYPTAEDDKRLIEYGYEPVPVSAPDPADKDAGKASFVFGWSSGEMTPERLAAMREVYPDHPGTGFRTDKLPAIDIDVVEPNHWAKIAQLVMARLGETIGREGSKGILLPYRIETPINKIVIRPCDAEKAKEAKVEILGRGQMFVGYGIHPGTGKPYRWDSLDPDFGTDPLTVPRKNLPEVTSDQLHSVAKEIAVLLKELGYGDCKIDVGRDKSAAIAPDVPLDLPSNVDRARQRLLQQVKNGKVSIIGANGDDTGYAVAAELVRDLGISEHMAVKLMLEYWYPACQPNDQPEFVREKVRNAARYGQNAPGAYAGMSAADTFAHVAGQQVSLAPELNADTPADIPTDDELVSHRALDIPAVPLRWFWKNRLPAGKLSLFAGNPDCGKTGILCNIAAIQTRGGDLPYDGGHVVAGNVVILTGEDDAADTLIPRLMAAGADLSKIEIIDVMVKKAGGGERLLDLDMDLDRVKKKIEGLNEQEREVKLVLIDPINSYLGAATNTFRSSDVRRVMTPISQWAAKMGIAVVGTMHLNKNVAASTALNRITDSHALGALSRAVWMCAPEKDEDGEETGRFLCMRGKGNLAPRTVPNLAYKLEGVDVPMADGSTYNHPRVVWDGVVTITADEAFSADYGRERSKGDHAAKFLEAALAEGPMAVTDLRRMAVERGLGWRTVERAKAKLAVRSQHAGFGPGSLHEWHLPDMEAETAEREAEGERMLETFDAEALTGEASINVADPDGLD